MSDKWLGEHRHEDEETRRARYPGEGGGRDELISGDLVNIMLLMRSLDVAYGGSLSPYPFPHHSSLPEFGILEYAYIYGGEMWRHPLLYRERILAIFSPLSPAL